MENKTQEYYEGLDKRSKEFKRYKASLIMSQESEGLGDTIEKITQATGLKKLVKAIFGEDCGCDERKARLNKLWKYKKRVECLEEDEYQYLKGLFGRMGNKINPSDQEISLRIYNRVFNEKFPPTQCSTCWKDILANLGKIYNEYATEIESKQ